MCLGGFSMQYFKIRIKRAGNNKDLHQKLQTNKKRVQLIKQITIIEPNGMEIFSAHDSLLHILSLTPIQLHSIQSDNPMQMVWRYNFWPL